MAGYLGSISAGGMADIQRQIRQYRATHGIDMPQGMIDALIQGAAKTNADQATRRAALAQDASQFDRALALKSEMFDTQEKRLKQAQESQQLMGGLGLAYKVGGDIWKDPDMKKKIKGIFGYGGENQTEGPTDLASYNKMMGNNPDGSLPSYTPGADSGPSNLAGYNEFMGNDPSGEMAGGATGAASADINLGGDYGEAGGVAGGVASMETPGYGETVTQFAGSTSADPYGETSGMFSASDAPVPGGAIDAGQDAAWDAAAGEWTGPGAGTDGGVGGELGGGFGGVAGAGGVSAGLTALTGALQGKFDFAKTADSGIAGGAGYLAGAAIGGPVGVIAGAVAGTIINQVLGGGRVICTELNRQGLLPNEVLELDIAHSRANFDEDVWRGYLFWATPVAKLMRRSRIFTLAIKPIVESWSYSMAARMRPDKYESRILGEIFLVTGVPVCRTLGRYLRKREEEVTAWTC